MKGGSNNDWFNTIYSLNIHLHLMLFRNTTRSKTFRQIFINDAPGQSRKTCGLYRSGQCMTIRLHESTPDRTKDTAEENSLRSESLSRTKVREEDQPQRREKDKCRDVTDEDRDQLLQQWEKWKQMDEEKNTRTSVTEERSLLREKKSRLARLMYFL